MDGLDRVLAAKRERAKAALLEEMRSPSCGTCGHGLDARAWRSPGELKAKVYGAPDWEYGDGATISLALGDLIDAGLVEQSQQLKVRLNDA